MARALSAALLVCLLIISGCREENSATSTTGPSRVAESTTSSTPGAQPATSSTPTRTRPTAAGKVEARYALPATLECLNRQAGVTTTARTKVPRLQALRDLAQRTSVIVRVRNQELGLAIVQSGGHAQLLAELLRAPNNPYRILTRHNAVIFHVPEARPAVGVVTGCLRRIR